MTVPIFVIVSFVLFLIAVGVTFFRLGYRIGRIDEATKWSQEIMNDIRGIGKLNDSH